MGQGYNRGMAPGRHYSGHTVREARVIIDDLLAGRPIAHILRDLGVPPGTYYARCARDPVWAAEISRARSQGHQALADRLLDPEQYEAKSSGHWARSVQWYLERRGRDEWGPRLDVHHEVRVSLVDGLRRAAEREQLLLESRSVGVASIAPESPESPESPERGSDE